jgi:hypothetical protein
VESVRTQAAATVAAATQSVAAPAGATDGNSAPALHENAESEASPVPAPSQPEAQKPQAPAAAAAPESPTLKASNPGPAAAAVRDPTPAPAAPATRTAAAIQAAATAAAASSTAAGPQVAPTNINVAINIFSPGDRGPVVQTSTSPAATPRAAPADGGAARAGPVDDGGGGPTSWTWNWNWSWGSGCGATSAPSTSPSSSVAGGAWSFDWNWSWDCAPEPPPRARAPTASSVERWATGLAGSITSDVLDGRPLPDDVRPGLAPLDGGRASRSASADGKRHASKRRGGGAFARARGGVPPAGRATPLLWPAAPSASLPAAGATGTTGAAIPGSGRGARDGDEHGTGRAPAAPIAPAPIDASSSTPLAGGVGGGGGGGVAAALLLAAIVLTAPEIFTRLRVATAVRRPKPRSSRLDRPG